MLPRGFLLVGIALGLIALVFAVVLVLQAIHGALSPPVPDLPENDRRVAIFFEVGDAEVAEFARELWRTEAEPLISRPLEEVDRIGADHLPHRSRFYPARLAICAGRLYVIEEEFPHIHRFTLPDLMYDGPTVAKGILPAGDRPQSLSIEDDGSMLAVGWEQVTAIGARTAVLSTEGLGTFAAGCAIGEHIFLYSPYRSAGGPDLLFDRLTRDLQPVDSVGERRHLQRVSANYTAITDLAAHAGKIYLFSCGDAASVRYDPASDDTERLPLPGKGVGRMAEEYAVWQADHGRGAWNVSSIVAQAASAGGHLFLLSVRAHEVGWQGVARDLVIAEVDTAFQPLRLWHITLRPQKQTVFLQIFIRDFAVALIEGKTLFFLSVYRGYQDLEVDDWREYRSLHVLRPVDQSSASVNSQPQ